jgi:hypothetical protein
MSNGPILPADVLAKYTTEDLSDLVAVIAQILAERTGRD